MTVFSHFLSQLVFYPIYSGSDDDVQCSKTSQYKQVGNAVPPLMAKAIAQQLSNTLWQEMK